MVEPRAPEPVEPPASEPGLDGDRADAASPLQPPPPPVLPAPPPYGPPPPPSFGYSVTPGHPGVSGWPMATGWDLAYAPRLIPAAPPPPTEALLAIPLGPRRLVGQALDLLTKTDSGLRGASFYIGFVLLVTLAPVVALSVLGMFGMDPLVMDSVFSPGAGAASDGTVSPAAMGILVWAAWTMLAGIPATFGYLVASIESEALAIAVLGARAEGRPMGLPAAIAVVRQTFWTLAGVTLLVGLLGGGVSLVVTLLLAQLPSAVEEAVGYAVSLVVSVVIGTPFVYAPAAVILGGTGIGESIQRSVRLAGARKRLAVIVTLFGVGAQYIVLFGISAGLDVVARFVDGTGMASGFPAPLVVPVTAALVFAVGTLMLTVSAISQAPPVFAFLALTHYSHGLERGRVGPVPLRFWWDPWITPGLVLTALVALVALLGGVASLPA